ncbi:hypothetical protein F4679DRAFT_221752 [Xylaria curta]|nr:hypothetical protein F4679DRAFT_221752 [Xylaria curta]
MSHAHEKELPAPPRPTPPEEAQRPFTRYSLSSSSSSSSSAASFYSSSPSPPPLQPKTLLQKTIQQLRSENTLLQNEIDTLQATIQALRRRHAHELDKRTENLRKQNQQCHRQLDRQTELITNVVNTIYTIFADYKEEVRSLKRLSSDGEDEAASATHEIRVYNGLEQDSWL